MQLPIVEGLEFRSINETLCAASDGTVWCLSTDRWGNSEWRMPAVRSQCDGWRAPSVKIDRIYHAVDRIVASAWWGEQSDRKLCIHVDGDEWNCRPENLGWVLDYDETHALCRKCRCWKYQSEFSKQAKVRCRPVGYYCKSCCAQWRRHYRKTGRDKKWQFDYRRTIKGRATCLLNECRKSSTSKKLAFDLTIQWIVERLECGRCEATGVEFDLAIKNRRCNARSPSIDRVVPDMGYMQSNCQLVIWCYNRAKNDGTKQDVIDMAVGILTKEGLLNEISDS